MVAADRDFTGNWNHVTHSIRNEKNLCFLGPGISWKLLETRHRLQGVYQAIHHGCAVLCMGCNMALCEITTLSAILGKLGRNKKPIVDLWSLPAIPKPPSLHHDKPLGA